MHIRLSTCICTSSTFQFLLIIFSIKFHVRFFIKDFNIQPLSTSHDKFYSWRVHCVLHCKLHWVSNKDNSMKHTLYESLSFQVMYNWRKTNGTLHVLRGQGGVQSVYCNKQTWLVYLIPLVLSWDNVKSMRWLADITDYWASDSQVHFSFVSVCVQVVWKYVSLLSGIFVWWIVAESEFVCVTNLVY